MKLFSLGASYCGMEACRLLVGVESPAQSHSAGAAHGFKVATVGITLYVHSWS